MSVQTKSPMQNGLVEKAVDHAEDEFDRETEVLDGQGDESFEVKRTGIEERAKRKAKRPSKMLSSMGNGVNHVNGTTDTILNGHLANGTSRNGLLLKKFAKNSRRPRNCFGRGLPKKGELVIFFQKSGVQAFCLITYRC